MYISNNKVNTILDNVSNEEAIEIIGNYLTEEDENNKVTG